MTNEHKQPVQIDPIKERRARILKSARAKKQSGELSMIEAFQRDVGPLGGLRASATAAPRLDGLEE